MTNRYLLFTLFTFLSFASFSQGTGKLEINADLSAIAAYDPTIEVSIINMKSNREVVRQKVSDGFHYAFPLDGHFMLYFKKEGYNTTRLMLDTRTFVSGAYTISFGLEMEKNESGIVESVPIGTIKFDKTNICFGYKSAELLAQRHLKVVSSVRESEAVTF